MTNSQSLINTWNKMNLGQVATLQRGYDLPYRLRSSGNVPVVTSTGVTDTHSEAKEQAPGVVTGRYGTIGQVFYIEENYWPHNTTLFIKDFHGNDPLFVSYLLRTIDFHSHSGKSGVPGVNRNDLHALRVRIPPLPEQRSIATTLSDIDELLSALDRLITKKRDLKQATMQQLLTGKTRLPGFNGEWELKPFGDVVLLRRDRVDPRRSKLQEFCVELEHISSGSGVLIGNTTINEQSSIKSVFSPGNVLFGKLRSYLRKYWLADTFGVCSTEIWVFVPKDNLITTEFLFQIVKTDKFVEESGNSYGTHMPRSDWKVVSLYQFPLPPLPEQTAIASILSDMDTEIATLEQRRHKTRDLKQAMMQELLTGRIRLV
jgi:type I restriction enzyme, S subunit